MGLFAQPPLDKRGDLVGVAAHHDVEVALQTSIGQQQLVGHTTGLLKVRAESFMPCHAAGPERGDRQVVAPAVHENDAGAGFFDIGVVAGLRGRVVGRSTRDAPPGEVVKSSHRELCAGRGIAPGRVRRIEAGSAYAKQLAFFLGAEKGLVLEDFRVTGHDARPRSTASFTYTSWPARKK